MWYLEIMKKSLRIEIWNRYGQRCSYCGKHLLYSDMQVDHLIPRCGIYKPGRYANEAIIKHCQDFREKIEAYSNLMPACRRCNHYKRAHSLSEFRRLISTLHKKIADDYITKVAIDYGIVRFEKWDGLFYFEKLQLKQLN